MPSQTKVFNNKTYRLQIFYSISESAAEAFAKNQSKNLTVKLVKDTATKNKYFVYAVQKPKKCR
jgi:hypothetical protein